jgi:hypothetical protein
MFSELILSAAMICGQVGAPPIASLPAVAMPAERSPALQLLLTGEPVDVAPIPQASPPDPGNSSQPSLRDPSQATAPAKTNDPAPAVPPETAPEEAVEAAPAAEAPPPPAAAPDRWLVMRALQGTWYGDLLDRNRLSISGWAEMAFTGSSATASNLPETWNDRPNTFNVHQLWVRFDRALVTSGTTKPSFGGRVDFLYGTDYRYTLMRGLLNDQLEFSAPNQQFYGYDLPQFYLNMYVPTIMQGLELRVGKMFCPWGVESIEGPSTPFLSRSYAFNSSPPFTHFGVMAILNMTPKWQLQAMAVNGNDVWIGDPSQEWRFVGKLQWTSADKRQNLSFATSVGRGVFNTDFPHPQTTVATPAEPLGRNNLNAFDLVYFRQLTSRLQFATEGILGYQLAPAGTPGFPDGHAIWASVAMYGFWTITPRLQAVIRGETFDDFQGQRTGFTGVYTETTAGLQWKPRKDVLIRPEIRFDNNSETTPFDNGTRSRLLTGAIDVILRY